MEGVDVVGVRPSRDSYGVAGDSSFTFGEQLQWNTTLGDRFKRSVVEGASILRNVHKNAGSVDRIVQGYPVTSNRSNSFSEGRRQLHFQYFSGMLVVNVGQAGGQEAHRVITCICPYQGREGKIQACFEITIRPVLRRGTEFGGV